MAECRGTGVPALTMRGRCSEGPGVQQVQGPLVLPVLPLRRRRGHALPGPAPPPAAGPAQLAGLSHEPRAARRGGVLKGQEAQTAPLPAQHLRERGGGGDGQRGMEGE